MSEKQFKLDKKQVIDNIVYLVIDNPHEGNYGYFQGCFPTMKKAIESLYSDSLEDVQEILDLPEETQPTKELLVDYFKAASNPHIIPIFGLDKSKPVYVQLTGNDFYLGISQNKVDGKRNFLIVF